jgi:hypothetical protein
VQKAQNSPVKGQKGAFFAPKGHFFHPKTSLFFETNSAPILYFQQLTGFGRIIFNIFFAFCVP